jgi:hypothetical protein
MLVGMTAGVAVGCDTDVEFGNTGGAGGTGGAGQGGGTTTVSTTSTGGARESCPTEEPRDQAPCMKQGLHCEYGDGPIVSCRKSYSCGFFNLWEMMGGNCSPYPNEEGCPATKPASMTQCPEEGKLCLYDDDATQCGCTSCFGGPCTPPPAWLCVDPPSGGCPPEAPNFGQPCPSEGLSCSYGACGINTQTKRDCLGGIWVDIPVRCPL